MSDRPIDPNTQLTATLSAAHWNVVMMLLVRFGTWEQADPIKKSLEPQLSAAVRERFGNGDARQHGMTTEEIDGTTSEFNEQQAAPARS